MNETIINVIVSSFTMFICGYMVGFVIGRYNGKKRGENE